MPKATDALRRKAEAGRPSHVVVVSSDTSVLAAAKLMNLHRIGALPVIDARSRLVGMFTERDVLTRVVAAEESPDGTRVGDVMTSPVVTCSLDTCLDEIRRVMREQRIRHMPVLDGAGLVGMLSLTDLSAAEVKVMTDTISYLERYMYAG